MKFIIGTDADGVLTDLTAFNLRDGKNYFKKDPINPDAYSTSEMFGVTKKQEFIYGARGALNRYCKNEPPREGSVEIINSLQNNKDIEIEIHSITARKFATSKTVLGKYYRALFENWLKKYEIKFNSIQYCSENNSPEEKLLGCSKLKVDLMIEDKPDVALYLANNGIKVLLMDAPYNQNIYHENITRIYNWNNALEQINILIDKKVKNIEKLNNEVKKQTLSNISINKSYISKNKKYTISKKVHKFKKLNKDVLSNLSDSSKIEYFNYYHHYLKNAYLDLQAIQRGQKHFKLVYPMGKVLVKIFFNPKIIDKKNIPSYQKGYIIASNHLNSYDQYMMSYGLGNVPFSGFIASTVEDTFRGKCFKWFGGAIVIDRENSYSRKKSEEEFCIRTLNDLVSLIYPEGTRKNKTVEGRMKEQLPFKMGVVAMAQKTGSPILPVSVYYGKKQTYVRFGKLFYVNATDNLEHSIKKLENIILSMTRKSTNEELSKVKVKRI